MYIQRRYHVQKFLYALTANRFRSVCVCVSASVQSQILVPHPKRPAVLSSRLLQSANIQKFTDVENSWKTYFDVEN